MLAQVEADFYKKIQSLWCLIPKQAATRNNLVEVAHWDRTT